MRVRADGIGAIASLQTECDMLFLVFVFAVIGAIFALITLIPEWQA